MTDPYSEINHLQNALFYLIVAIVTGAASAIGHAINVPWLESVAPATAANVVWATGHIVALYQMALFGQTQWQPHVTLHYAGYAVAVAGFYAMHRAAKLKQN